MPHFFRDPAGKMTNILQLDHTPLVNGGTCVELAKKYAAGLEGFSTKTWEAGERVIDLSTIAPGVAIATFTEVNGKLAFPGWDTGNHFAFVVRVSGMQNGKVQELVVMDQFQHPDPRARRPEVTTRKIFIQPKPKHQPNGNPEMSNDLRYFYIIK